MVKPKVPYVKGNEAKNIELFQAIHGKPVDNERVKHMCLHRLVVSHNLSHQDARKILGLPLN
jgi:hypothetical protein